jgi:uncharacterized protein YheU (UPF0270 family)
MAQFIEVPTSALAEPTLLALLEEFASRDGTDYGLNELSLDEKVGRLREQLNASRIMLMYDSDSEQWDLVERDSAQTLLSEVSVYEQSK